MRRKPPGWVVLVPVLWVLGCVAILLMAGVVFGAAQAQQPQQAPCGPRDDLIKNLKSQFDESLAGHGVINEQTILELTVSPKGTWSLFFTNNKGRSCFLASGEGWETAPTPEPGTPL